MLRMSMNTLPLFLNWKIAPCSWLAVGKWHCVSGLDSIRLGAIITFVAPSYETGLHRAISDSRHQLINDVYQQNIWINKPLSLLVPMMKRWMGFSLTVKPVLSQSMSSIIHRYVPLSFLPSLTAIRLPSRYREATKAPDAGKTTWAKIETVIATAIWRIGRGWQVISR